MMYPWLQAQWQLLWNQYQQQRIAHAILMTGMQGVGKEALAYAYAKLLLCHQVNQHTRTACGQCQGCHWWDSGSHPDFFPITLLEKSKAIKVDQVRELTQALTQTAQRGGYQVAVITPADTMNTAACNALLKTLEEPSGKVVLILVANQCQRLPATIISRCQKVTVNVHDPAVVEQWLREQVEDQESVGLLRRAAYGSPRLALTLAQNDFMVRRQHVFQQWLALLQQQADPISAVEKIIKDELMLWFSIVLSLIDDIIKYQSGVAIEYLIHQDQGDVINTMAAMIPPMKCHYFRDKLIETQRLLFSGVHINVQLALESLLLQWMSLAEKPCLSG